MNSAWESDMITVWMVIWHENWRMSYDCKSVWVGKVRVVKKVKTQRMSNESMECEDEMYQNFEWVISLDHWIAPLELELDGDDTFIVHSYFPSCPYNSLSLLFLILWSLISKFLLFIIRFLNFDFTLIIFQIKPVIKTRDIPKSKVNDIRLTQTTLDELLVPYS